MKDNKDNKKIHMRLQTILFLLITLVVVISVSTTAFFSYRTYKQGLIDRVAASRNDVLMQVSAKVDLLQANMTSLSKLYFNLVSDFAQNDIQALFHGDNPQGSITAGQLMDAYQDVMNSMDVEYSVTMLDNEGLSYTSTKAEQDHDLTGFQNELWYIYIPHSLDKGEVYWTQSHKDPSIGDGFFFSAVKRTKNHEGKEITILINVSERVLYQTYQNIMSDNTIYIVDKSGRIISSNTERMVSLNYFNMHRLDQLVVSGGYSIVEKSGVKYLLSRYDNPKYDLVYLEEIPLENLLVPLRRMQRDTILATIFIIFLSSIVILIVVRTFTLPILRLCQKLKRVSDGDFDTRFDIQSWSEISLINDVSGEMVRKISSLFEDLKEEEKQKRLAELEFLQAQINPHFIYNSLFSVKCLVSLGENDTAERMLENFTAMLRTILGQKDEMISLQEELVILHQYFVVLQCKYGDEILLDVDIPEDLLKQRVLKFVLQPIVENSIFHGLEPAGSKGHVVVRAWERGARLYLSVEDDGAGMDCNRLKEVQGTIGSDNSTMVGINNTVKRIKLHFGAQYGVEISSEKDVGTKVVLILPSIKAEGQAAKGDGAY